MQANEAEQLRSKLKQLSDYDEMKRELEIMKVCFGSFSMPLFGIDLSYSMSSSPGLTPTTTRILFPMEVIKHGIFQAQILARSTREKVNRWKHCWLPRTKGCRRS